MRCEYTYHKWLAGDRWVLLIICPSLGPFLSVSKYLGRYLDLLAKTYFPKHQCIGFPNPMSGYFHHCAKTGDPAEQQTALSRSDTGANPQVAAQRTHCPVKPYTDWPRKIPGVCVEQMAAPFKTLHRVSGSGVIWHFSKSTQLSGPLLNTENMQSCLREPPFLSDAVSLGSSVLPQMDNENLLVSWNEMWKGHQGTTLYIWGNGSLRGFIWALWFLNRFLLKT